MKKFLLSVGVLAVFMGSAFARAPMTDYSGSYNQVQQLIDEDFKENKDQVKDLSKDLTPEQKNALYSEFKRSAPGYIALNMLTGWGLGSFIQRDKTGGFIQVGATAAGITAIYAGAAADSGPVMYAGLGLIAGSWLFGIVKPIVFSVNHNKTLKDMLNMNVESVSFAPIVNPVNQQYGLVARIAL